MQSIEIVSSRLVWGWLEACVVLLCHGLDHFLRGLWHVFYKFRCKENGFATRRRQIKGECTWRACEERQRGDDRVWRDDRVVRDLSTVLDDREFTLQDP